MLYERPRVRKAVIFLIGTFILWAVGIIIAITLTASDYEWGKYFFASIFLPMVGIIVLYVVVFIEAEESAE